MRKFKPLPIATILLITLAAILSAAPLNAKAATAQALASQLNGISGLMASSAGNVVHVTGRADVTSTINLNIDPGVIVDWSADINGSTASGRYLLNVSGSGTLNIDSAYITNKSGLITVTGEGASVNINGTLSTPNDGNGISLNVAANNVSVSIGPSGEITNNGTNSAINVTAGVTGVIVNVNGGRVVSEPSGYAINDGGTSLCANNTRIVMTNGEVRAGSACAIKSTGEGSIVNISGGMVSNAATVNSNPVIYMNGGVGDNVVVSGVSYIVAADNNLGYGIQTTGNVTINRSATISATAGRAINLVGMDSVATINGGRVSATTGIAICTATTNPATVANTTIIVNGGEIGTTDPNAAHGVGKTIYGTGENTNIIINGGHVYTASGNTEAIYNAGTNSSITVNGGMVTAKDHFAIEATGGGSIHVAGGFVFAYGTAITSTNTSSNVKTAALGSSGSITVDGEGVVVVWNRGAWAGTEWDRGEYTEVYAHHLVSSPPSLIVGETATTNNVFWQNNGNDGIYYRNGSNSGFLSDAWFENVTVVKNRNFVTVIGGTGTGPYDVNSTVTITADPAPENMEFEGWQVYSGDIADPSGETATFTMPDNDVTIAAIYRNKHYRLTVIGGSGGGAFISGDEVAITANPAPNLMEFERWTIVEGPGGSSIFSNASASQAMLKMPNGDLTVQALYRDVPRYSFTISGGTIASYTLPDGTKVSGSGSSGSFPAGTSVFINGYSSFPANYYFSGWIVKSGGGAFSGDNAFTQFGAEFVMPAANSAVEMATPYYMGEHYYTLTVINGVALTAIVDAPANNPDLDPNYYDTPAEASGDSPASDYPDYNEDAPDSSVSGNEETLETPEETPTPAATPQPELMAPATIRGYSPSQYVSIVADPAPEGKRFMGWTIVSGQGVFGNASAMATTFRMSNTDATIKAEYQPIEYPLAAEYCVISSGFYDGKTEGLYVMGETVSLTAISPGPAYRFTGWSQSGGADITMTGDMTANITMPSSSATVTAHWELLYNLEVIKGTIISVNGETVDSGTSSGFYAAGTTIVIRADEIEGETFIKWLGDGSLLSSTSSIIATITMPEADVEVQAEYKEHMYTVLFQLTIIDGEGNQTVEDAYSSQFVPIAVPAVLSDHRVFKGWVIVKYEGGKGNFEDAAAHETRFLMPNGNVTIEAVYATSHTLTVIHGDGSGTYFEGDTANITADPAEPGMVFSGWELNGHGSITNATTADTLFTMSDTDATITAMYSDISRLTYSLATVNCHITDFSLLPLEGGETVTIRADFPAGKTFSRWEIEGLLYDGDLTNPADITFIMPMNSVTVRAVFNDEQYLLTVRNGSGSGLYLAGDKVTIIADKPPAGQVFDYWTSDAGGLFGDVRSAGTSFTMPSAYVIVTAYYRDEGTPPSPIPLTPANYTRISYPVSYTSNAAPPTDLGVSFGFEMPRTGEQPIGFYMIPIGVIMIFGGVIILILGKKRKKTSG